MNIITFKILTPSKLEILFNKKRVIISGELTTTPVFYANINAFQCWEPPFDKEKITQQEQKDMIAHVTKESKKHGQTIIIFD